ncbi:uncharacterized protein ISCGN_013979 [Ixodes scapularis]
MELDRIIAAAKELGYTRDELKKWVDEERARSRAERAQERDNAREDREAAQRMLAAESAKLDKEREVLQLRIAAREGRGEGAANSESGRGEESGRGSHGSPHKLIPQFNERRDDLDAYLQRFERTATGLGWPVEKWAATLGLCLTGEALTVVGRLTPEDALDYAKVKLALFQRFRYTKEGYRERVLDRWLEIAGVEKTFESLRDIILVEQFLLTCSSKLTAFLRERDCQRLDDVAAKADLFLEAQVQHSTVRYLPEAVIVIRTPYCMGKITAKCVSNPLYDLILGNIPQMREANDPDPEWEKNNEENLGDCLDEPKERYETCSNAIGVNVGCRRAMEATKSIDELPDEKPAVAASASEGREAGRPIKKLERPLKVAQVSVTDTTAEELGKQQKGDATLTKCFNDVGKTTKKHNSRTRIQFLLKNDLLYRSVVYSSGRRSEQLALPKRFRVAAVTMAHDSIMSGHQGAKNTLNLVAGEFFWPCMQSEIKRYVRSCDVCQRTVPKGKVGKAPLGSMPIIDTLFQRVAIDIIGPIVPIASSGNRYILTMVDMATRYPDAVALKSIGSQQVAEALVQMFTRYGVPAEIFSDRGTNFTSELLREVSRLLSMKQLLTTPYHPISNGLVERFNGTIKQMLRRMCKERPKDWDRYLPALLFAYREVPQASLRFSPFELLYGRRVRGPLAILKELWSNEALKEDMKTAYEYILELREKLEETCKLAHVCLHEAREKYNTMTGRAATEI